MFANPQQVIADKSVVSKRCTAVLWIEGEQTVSCCLSNWSFKEIVSPAAVRQVCSIDCAPTPSAPCCMPGERFWKDWVVRLWLRLRLWLRNKVRWEGNIYQDPRAFAWRSEQVDGHTTNTQQMSKFERSKHNSGAVRTSTRLLKWDSLFTFVFWTFETKQLKSWRWFAREATPFNNNLQYKPTIVLVINWSRIGVRAQKQDISWK